MAYVTVAEFKQYTGVSEAVDDALISGLIASAQAAIDNYCHRTFEADEDTTKYFDAVGPHIDGLTLYFDDDLCAITTVTNGDDNVVSSSEYTTIPRNGTRFYAIRLLSQSGKTWTFSGEWMDAISITGRWAYSVKAPDDIYQACLRLASFYYREKDSPLTDVTAIEAGTVIRTPPMPGSVKALLQPYVDVSPVTF